jgi:Beta-lactamase
MSEAKKLPKWLKALLYLFWGLFGVGLVGYWYAGLTFMTGKPPRPDLELEALAKAAKAPLVISIVRYKSLIYPSDEKAPELSHPVAIGGLADAFTALAICKLEEQGKLTFDQPITVYMPELAPIFDQVTVAALLTHTSGLTAAMTELPISSPTPGLSSEKAPFNYQLLERLVTTLARIPQHQYIQTNIIGVLEMDQTHWDETKTSWVTTANDLLIFEEYLNSNRIVGLKTHLRAFTAPKLSDGSYADFNFGWEVRDCGGLRLERICSDRSDFNGAIMRFPEKNFAALILYEGPKTEFDTAALSDKLARIYLGREMRFPNR